MSTQDLQDKWTAPQQTYIDYLAAGKSDITGRKWTKAEISKMLGVDPATLWRWEQLDGFQEAVFTKSIRRMTEYIPAMNTAMIKKTLQKGDVSAYLALMRQAKLLQSDKQDVNAHISGSVGVEVVDFSNATTD